MDRWTERDENGIAYIKNWYKYTHGLQASENLALYEETGLTPEEIFTLKAQNKKMKAEICKRCKPILSENGIASYFDCRKCQWCGTGGQP